MSSITPFSTGPDRFFLNLQTSHPTPPSTTTASSCTAGTTIREPFPFAWDIFADFHTTKSSVFRHYFMQCEAELDAAFKARKDISAHLFSSFSSSSSSSSSLLSATVTPTPREVEHKENGRKGVTSSSSHSSTLHAKESSSAEKGTVHASYSSVDVSTLSAAQRRCHLLQRLLHTTYQWVEGRTRTGEKGLSSVVSFKQKRRSGSDSCTVGTEPHPISTEEAVEEEMPHRKQHKREEDHRSMEEEEAAAAVITTTTTTTPVSSDRKVEKTEEGEPPFPHWCSTTSLASLLFRSYGEGNGIDLDATAEVFPGSSSPSSSPPLPPLCSSAASDVFSSSSSSDASWTALSSWLRQLYLDSPRSSSSFCATSSPFLTPRASPPSAPSLFFSFSHHGDGVSPPFSCALFSIPPRWGATRGENRACKVVFSFPATATPSCLSSSLSRTNAIGDAKEPKKGNEHILSKTDIKKEEKEVAHCTKALPRGAKETATEQAMGAQEGPPRGSVLGVPSSSSSSSSPPPPPPVACLLTLSALPSFYAACQARKRMDPHKRERDTSLRTTMSEGESSPFHSSCVPTTTMTEAGARGGSPIISSSTTTTTPSAGVASTSPRTFAATPLPLSVFLYPSEREEFFSLLFPPYRAGGHHRPMSRSEEIEKRKKGEDSDSIKDFISHRGTTTTATAYARPMCSLPSMQCPPPSIFSFL